jgi:Flp pilus assembly protein TadG
MKLLAKLFRKDSRGVASIEFAFIATAVGVTLLNVSDVAIFMYDKLEVENATQMGAQAVYAACPWNQLPATVNCSGLTTAITAGIQSTSLGTAATLVSGYPTEAYYCVSGGALTSVGAVSQVNSGVVTAVPPPADCSAAGSSSTRPGDYLQIQVTYSFTPLFNGSLTVASLLPTTITNTAWVRLK